MAPAYITPSGAIRIVGYNDMQEMLNAINRLFDKNHPGMRWELELRSTRSAPPALAAGRSLLAPMGAEFSDTELAAYREAVGTEPLLVRVAHASLNPRALSAPLALYVHRDNPLTSLSLTQLARAFAPGPDAAPATVWGELGLGGAWAQRPIRLCGLAPHTALALFMQRHHFQGRQYSSQLTGFSQSAEAVACVAADPAALGFAAANRHTPGVKVLAVATLDGQQARLPDTETVKSGHYPLDRHLLVYLRRVPGQPIDRLALEYVKLMLSPAGQQAIADGSLGYLPLNAAEIATELSKLNE